MNTMLADSLNWIGGKLEAALDGGASKTEAVITVLQELMTMHGAVVFGGDGYSQEWHKMAVEERGLKNIPTTADALPALREASVVAMFESTGVLSPVELESRFEVYAEQYILSIEVEAKLVIDMAKTIIYPAAIAYLATLASTTQSLSGMGIELENSVARAVAENANALLAASTELAEALAKEDFATTEEHMQFCAGRFVS